MTEEVGAEAERLATQYGLSVADSLHVALALGSGCDELITTEGIGKPMHGVGEIQVTHLPPNAGV